MATLASARGDLILTQSKWLRLLTLFLFYFTQGAPLGVFVYAIPSWMAGNGASAADTAWVVGIVFLPWTLKLINGFLIDRYTFLAMGRRRAWIIGAQLLVAGSMLTGAALNPASSDIVTIAAIGFVANVAITFQDVGIDSLAVDIMQEEERARASSIMFGAQVLGIAATTGMVGFLLDNFGFREALLAAALVPLMVAMFGMVIREREGERRLPWSKGSSHPRNIDIQVDAWSPLLKNSFLALIAPLSLALLPILFLRALPFGGGESYHPILAQQVAGWTISEYTSLISTAQFSAGVGALLVAWWIVDKLGPQRSFMILVSIGIAAFVAMGLNQALWTDTSVLVSLFYLMEFLATFGAAALIPICMRMCNPAVAATQFTIYMACANFGRPLGASLSGMTAGLGNPTYLYFGMAAGWAVILAILFMVRFPKGSEGLHEVAEELPQGEGIAPRVD